MKIKRVSILIIFGLGCLWMFGQSRPLRGPVTVGILKSKVQPKLTEVAVTSMPSSRVRSSSLPKKGRSLAAAPEPRKSRALRDERDYEYEEVQGSQLKLVTNYRAIVPGHEAGEPFRGGYQLAPAQSEGELNLFFDPKRSKYLVWTREVVIRGDELTLADLAQRFQLEPLRAPVYRVPEGSSVRSVLEAVAARGLEIDLDLNSARVVAQ